MTSRCKLQVASCKGETFKARARLGRPAARLSAFTLLELSVVVLILALLAAAALRYAAGVTYANNVAATNATLDVIENALMNFRYANNRLPCPGNILLMEATVDFGLEAGGDSSSSVAAGTGECVTGSLTPAANYENGAAATDPDNGTTGYDSATAQQVEAGSVPTKTLRLADKYAYDAWGRKILYVVDKRITLNNAFKNTSYAPYLSSFPSSANSYGAGTIGAIVVKKTVGDPLVSLPHTQEQALTYKAIYALVSFGANGHGAYVRSINTASTVHNAGSQSADELKNCHCDSNAAAVTPWDRDFVQKPRTMSGSYSLYNTFDDIVRFKTRSEMAVYSEMQ